MKRLATALLFLAAASACAAEASLFEQANAKYQAGDFKSAIEIYQKLIQAGRGSEAVYYNLGNAAVKAGEKGQALVYYERALKAAPRDKDLRWNIRVLKGALTDKIEDTSYFVWTAFREFLDRWTPDEIAWTFGAFLALAALGAVAGLLSPAVKDGLSRLRPLVLLGITVFGSLLALKVLETKDPLVVVLDKEAYAYYGPSDHETKAFLLHEGAEGRMTDTSGDWLYITLSNKKTGWIRKNSCEIV